MAGWHFISLDKKSVEAIKKSQEGKKRIGWGSVPVVVTVGETTWKTSVFPDKSSGGFLMPLKAQVRKKEEIEAKDEVKVSISF